MLLEEARLFIEQTLLHLQSYFLPHRLQDLRVLLLLREQHATLFLWATEDGNESVLDDVSLGRKTLHRLVAPAVPKHDCGSLHAVLQELLPPTLTLLSHRNVAALA